MPMPVSRPWPLLAGLLIVLATGYWGFGKPFAYLGLYPLFIGEVALAVGLGLVAARGRLAVLAHPSFALYWLLLAVAAVQGLYSVLVRELPPLEVLRDLAVIYYGLYAYLAFALISDQGVAGFRWLVERGLPRMFPWILGAFALTFVATILVPAPWPKFPGTDVEILFYKPTDAVMPFLLVMALALRGLLPLPYFLASLLPALINAARSRSVMLCFLATVLLTLRPSRRYLTRIGALVVLVGVLGASGLKLDLGGYREFSASQFMANSLSLLNDDERSGSMDPTTTRNKAWRAQWWERILEDATSEDRLWIGLGWGVNLAREYAISAPHSTHSDLNAVRNPHNAFMGILARGGWLAAGLWALFYLTLLLGLARAAWGGRDRELAGLSLGVLVYLVVSLINGSTDVFLESPQVAIPHWIMVGLGWGLLKLSGQAAEPTEEPVARHQLAQALGHAPPAPGEGQEQ